MVDRQSNWSLISAVRHIWAPYHHDQCWVSLLPTAPGGVPSRRDGSLNDVVTLFPPLSNPVWAETTQRDQATKYGWQQIQNTELATKPNWINHNPLALQPSFLSNLWSSTYILAKTICKINFAIYKYI